MKRINSLLKIQKKVYVREILCRRVIEFLERDDNSCMMLGKNDKKKVENGYV